MIQGLVAAALAVACEAAQPPAALSRVIQVAAVCENGKSSTGHGFSPMPGILVTAKHILEANCLVATYRWRNGLDTAGVAVPVSEQKEDVAKLRMEGGVYAPSIPVAERKPRPGERLWYVGYEVRQGGIVPQDVYWAGRYVGRDEDGLLMIDGAGLEGISGSPVVTDDGLVVGIMSVLGFPERLFKDFTCDKQREEKYSCTTQLMFHVIKHRSFVFAVPLEK